MSTHANGGGGGRYCVVGAGPGGLAVAHAFRLAGIEFDIYDRLPALGGIWDIAHRESPVYERLRLISPARLSGFDGFPMPATFPDYPGHKEVIGYLHDFARSFELCRTLRSSSEVSRLRPVGRGWEVSTQDGSRRQYAGVVLACGHNWRPHLPPYAGREAIHSVRYRRPEPYAGRSVLVVGGGNSGCDIACDLVGTADRVALSLRRGYFFLPRYVRGRPTAEWAASPDFSERILGALLGRQLRLLDPFGVPRPNHHLFESNPVVNDEIIDAITSGDISVRPDVTGLVEKDEKNEKEGRGTAGATVTFADGSRETFDAVIFATGYQYSVPLLDQILTWPAGRPALHANIFHPRHDQVFVVGLLEYDGSAFPVLSAQAAVIARVVGLQNRGVDRARLRDIIRAASRTDLSGGRSFVDSHRHTISVHRGVYLDFLARLGRDLDTLDRSWRFATERP